MISPSLREKEGIFTIFPLTKICLCVTNCLAPLLVLETPNLKTILSSLDSSNMSKFSPVIPDLREAFLNKFLNCFSNIP